MTFRALTGESSTDIVLSGQNEVAIWSNMSVYRKSLNTAKEWRRTRYSTILNVFTCLDAPRTQTMSIMSVRGPPATSWADSEVLKSCLENFDLYQRRYVCKDITCNKTTTLTMALNLGIPARDDDNRVKRQRWFRIPIEIGRPVSDDSEILVIKILVGDTIK